MYEYVREYVYMSVVSVLACMVLRVVYMDKHGHLFIANITSFTSIRIFSRQYQESATASAMYDILSFRAKLGSMMVL